MDISAQLVKIQQKIKEYKAKFPKRNWTQKQELNCLWLELAYWQLIERGEIKLPNYLAKIEKSWEHLKDIKQKSGKWPRKRLLEFLKRQKKDYGQWLVWVISLEQKEEYLKFRRWLRKWVKENSS